MEKNYALRDASELLGIKIRTLREWIKTGKIKAVKYQGCNMWFVTESEIKRVAGGNNE